jgi:hypothetical protein
MAFKPLATTTSTNGSPKPLQRARTAAAALVITVAIPTLVVGGLPAAVTWSVNQGSFLEAVLLKSIGRDEPCPWGKLLDILGQSRDLFGYKRSIAVASAFSKMTELYRSSKLASPTRPFWIKRDGTCDWSIPSGVRFGRGGLEFSEAPNHRVRPGDIVVDIGAHIGSFGDEALRRGARRVIMVEPDPINVECLRRNFRDGDRPDGRVTVVPERRLEQHIFDRFQRRRCQFQNRQLLH